MWGLSRPWPVPALLAWLLGWVLFVWVRNVWHWDMPWAWCLGVVPGVVLMGFQPTPLRRWVVALGFAVSCALLVGWWGASGNGSPWADWPAWMWLLPVGLLGVLYPPSTWRDAPVFPTPAGALDGLAQRVPLPLAGHVLDAGCGLGDGLLALERAYPEVHLVGLERSWPLRWACGWRCPQARVVQGDMWAHPWSRYDLVYLFQRPETMPRAWHKAQTELKPGAWLASLEFAVPNVTPTDVWMCPDGRPVWLYRMQSVA